MRAAVYEQYGPPEVVHVRDVPKPAPKAGEVLVRVHATTVSSGDHRVRSLEVPRGFGLFVRPAFGLFGPRKKILGTELSGVIEAVGEGVTRFAIGDAVFAFPGLELGAHAEYRVMPEDGRIARKPAGVSFEEAAAICFGGATALHFLRDLGGVRPGEHVLVVGASGAVGSAAVQIARHLGAKVTGVTSATNVDRVRALGTERVIDYTTGPFLEPGVAYDVIFDTVGSLSFAPAAAHLRDGGRLLLAAAGLPDMITGPWAARGTGKRAIAGNAAETPEMVRALAGLVEAGAFRPLVDATFPLERIVEAHARVASGRKRGSVVVTMGV